MFIVADYEVRTGGDDETAAGMRVAAKFDGGQARARRERRHEGAQAGDTRIVGSDLTWRVSDETRVRAEVAQSQSDDPLKPESSTAWLVEGKHASDRIEARAWARETGDGLRRRPAAHRGHRHARPAASMRATSSPRQLLVSGEVQHQTVLASDATRLLASADVQMQKDGYSVGGGVRHVDDKDAGGDERVSDQAFLTGERRPVGRA